jgi:hypothetical protein
VRQLSRSGQRTEGRGSDARANLQQWYDETFQTLTPFQTSLRERMYFRAQMNRVRAQSTPIHTQVGCVGVRYGFERRLLGVIPGIHHNAVLLSPLFTAPLQLDGIIGNHDNLDFANYQIAAPTTPDASLPPGRFRFARFLVAVERSTERMVLPLSTTYSEFLYGVGRSTRRHLRKARRKAMEEGLLFHCAERVDESKRRALRMLISKRTVAILQSLPEKRELARTLSKPYFAFLTDRNGRLVSATGGFIENTSAFIWWQFYSKEHRSLSPRLTMQSFLIEHLIKARVKRLMFTGGCGGVLYHACEPSTATDVLLVRDSWKGHAKAAAFAFLRPNTKIAYLLSKLIRSR